MRRARFSYANDQLSLRKEEELALFNNNEWRLSISRRRCAELRN